MKSTKRSWPRISRPARTITAVTAVTAMLALAGCSGGGSSETRAEGADLVGATSIDELYELAKEEGKVVWFAPKPEDQMKPAIEAFEKKYPGIDVEYANKKAPDLVSQLKLEQASKSVSFDVSNAGGLTVVPSVELAANADWSAFGVSDDKIFEDNFVYIWAVPKVWAYNTDSVDEGDAPATWDDLLAPSFEGKLAVESRGSFMTVWAQNPEMGEEAGLEYAGKLTENDPHFTENTTQAHSMITSGQASAGTSLVNLVLSDQKKGAPIAISPVSPTNANKAYLYVPNGSPHPAAARLLTAFLASDDGQEALAPSYNSAIPANTDCSVADENEVVKALCDAGVEWFGETDLDQYNQFSAFFPKVQEALGTDI